MSRSRAALALLFTLLLASCAPDTPEQEAALANLPAPESVNYRSAAARRGTLRKTIGADAAAVYPVTQELFVEAEGLKLKSLQVRTGDTVQAGDVLAVCQAPGSPASLEEKRLALRRAKEEARAESARRRAELERARAASTGGEAERIKLALLQSELEQYEAQARREAELLRDEIQKMERESGERTLAAPFDGVISFAAYKNPGDRVEWGETLVTVQSLEKLLLRAKDSTGAFRYNDLVTVEVGKRNERKSFTGRVVAADNVLPQSLRKGEAYIELDAPEGENLLNPSVTVETIRLEDVLLLDRQAVGSENGKRFITLLTEGGVRKRYVVAGLSSLDDVWVLQGVAEGQEAVLD